jgi:hypothetical protein
MRRTKSLRAAVGQQLFESVAVDIVGFRQQGPDALPLDVLTAAVGVHHMKEQRSRGDAWIFGLAFVRVAGKLFQKTDQPFEHFIALRRPESRRAPFNLTAIPR